MHLAVNSIVEQQRSQHRLITVAGGSLGRQVALDTIGRIFGLVAVVAAPPRSSPPSPPLRRSQLLLAKSEPSRRQAARAAARADNVLKCV